MDGRLFVHKPANSAGRGGAPPEFVCVLLLRALFDVHALLEMNAAYNSSNVAHHVPSPHHQIL